MIKQLFINIVSIVTIFFTFDKTNNTYYEKNIFNRNC
jgi:hypothetical protein